MVTDIRVPDGWGEVRLEDVASLRKRQVKPAADDSRPYVALEHIMSGGSLKGFGKAGDSVSNKTTFHTGDTLYGKLRPNLRKVVRASFDGICSTDILAVFAHDLTDSSFLSHLIRSDLLHRHAMRGITGTKMPRTSWSHLQGFNFGLPPLSEQRAIAAVLDSIDEAIERTEAVITSTERLRESLLHELLTRGVPGWHSEWKEVRGIGTIPADWEVVRLGDVSDVTSGLAMGPHRSPRDNPKPYLTVANVQADHVKIGKPRFMELTEREYSSRTLRTGDVVLGIL